MFGWFKKKPKTPAPTPVRTHPSAPKFVPHPRSSPAVKVEAERRNEVTSYDVTNPYPVAFDPVLATSVMPAAVDPCQDDDYRRSHSSVCDTSSYTSSYDSGSSSSDCGSSSSDSGGSCGSSD